MARDGKKSIIGKLDDITGNNKYSRFVVWYCTDEKEREPFEEYASKNNNNNVTWDFVSKYWLTDENVLEGIRYYMKILHTQKMKNIYDTMYQQAINGDVQSAKYLIDFAKDFFKDDGISELDSLLSGIDVDEE
ncbi:hypothetical protein [Tissierella sp.]|uniref:hypothetical protein n=1 Tax=Tissierella sp. TaxID=41274 RepID=UPI003053C65A